MIWGSLTVYIAVRSLIPFQLRKHGANIVCISFSNPAGMLSGSDGTLSNRYIKRFLDVSNFL
jgi:hypothetical protein